MANFPVFSSGRAGIIGLWGFAGRLRRIWHGAAAADPYADWWLLKIEQALRAAEVTLRSFRAEVATHLQGAEAMVVAPACTTLPLQLPLHFTAAQAYRGAQLIAESDAIACAVLTARHVGRLSAKRAARILWQLGRTVRRTFNAVCGYRRSGIVRTDRENTSECVAHGVHRMGVLPQGVFDESVMPENLPPRRLRTRLREERAKPRSSSHPLAITAATESSPLHQRPMQFEDDFADLFAAP